MSYQKSVQRVLAGSLNLRARATEIPGDDHQKSVNLAYDQAGGLRSRKGHQLICTASGSVSQMIHAMGSRWQATEDAYIAGFKRYVWKMGTGEANKDCAAIISTAGPRKSDGEHDWRWIPEAPTAAPTITTGEDVITVVDDFTGGWVEDTNVDDDGDPTPVDENDFTDNGLLVRGGNDTVKSFTKTVALDLYDGFDGDDVFKVILRAKHWSKIRGVAFEVDVGDGSFKHDYYRCRMPLKEVLAAKKESITFYMRKRLLEPDAAALNKNRWGAFERIGQTSDKDWRSVVALRVKVEFAQTTKLWFSNWVMVGNEDNTLEGDNFQVCYTYDTEDGHESNPSPWSKEITVNHGSIHVTEMVASGDEQVVGQNIYIRGGTLALPYRVNGAKLDADTGEPTETDPITGTEYDIIATADELSDLGIILEDDHDDPPDATGLADGPFYGRILAFKDNRFYWSHQNKPFAFANPDGPDGDWDDIDENAGDIKRMVVRFQQTRLYCEHAIFVLEGDPADAFAIIHPSGIEMGTPSRFGVCKGIGGVDIAYLGSGIYLVDDTSVQKVSEQIEPIFQGLQTSLWDGTVARPIEDPTTVAVGYEDGIIWVSHTNGTLVLDVKRGRWFQDSRLFTCFAGEGETGILGGQANGKVLHLNTGISDDGAAIDIDFLSKAYDCGIHDNEKVFSDVTIYHDTAGVNLGVTLYGAEGVPIATDPVVINSFGADRTVLKINSGEGHRSRNLAVRITGEATFPIFIDSIDINWYLEPREGKAYDTGVVNGGNNRVKLIRELRPVLENNVDVEFRLQGDILPHALVEREAHTVSNHGGFRRAEPIVMDAEIYAHVFRVIAESQGAGLFHLHELEVLLQWIGTWLDGDKGEYYLSDAIDFGSERVQLWKEMQFIYRSLGPAQLSIKSDLPSGTLAHITGSPFVLPANGSIEKSYKLPLTGDVKGRLWEVRIEPDVGFRLEGIRRWGKFIGTPNATPWEWAELPLQKTQDAIWTSLTFPQDAPG